MAPIVSHAGDEEEALKLHNKAIQLYRQGKYAEAAKIVERVVKIKERLISPDHPETANSLINLAGLYHKMGDYARAEPMYKRVPAIVEDSG